MPYVPPRQRGVKIYIYTTGPLCRNCRRLCIGPKAYMHPCSSIHLGASMHVMCAYKHACMHPCMHACVCAHENMHAVIHASCICAFMQTFIHAYVRHIHMCIHANMQTCIHAFMQTCLHTCINLQVCMRTCVHLYMQSCLHTCMMRDM